MLEFSYLSLYPEYVLFRESDIVRFSVARCQEWPVLAHSYTVVSECKVALSRLPHPHVVLSVIVSAGC